MIEVLVRIKSEDFTISERFLHYEPFSLSKDDPVLLSFISQTLQKAVTPLIDPEIVVKTTFLM